MSGIGRLPPEPCAVRTSGVAVIIEDFVAEWERASADLEAAIERLRISRARLQVLTDALERAQGRTRWLRVFLPL